MQPIQPDQVRRQLQEMAGARVYLHMEFCRGGFLRNLAADVTDAVLRGDGPWRVALRCPEHGWVVMEDLTHMDELPHGGLGLYALESEPDQRLSRALQISREPFAP